MLRDRSPKVSNNSMKSIQPVWSQVCISLRSNESEGDFTVFSLLKALVTVFAGFFVVGLSIDNVTLTSCDSQLKPLKDLSKGRVVSINNFLFKPNYEPFTVVHFLIELEITIFGPKNLVLFHLIWNFILDEAFGRLPEEKLRMRLANLLPCEAQQIHQTLKNLWHLQNTSLVQFCKLKFPIFIIYK